MNFLFASDSFKGSLTSEQIARLLAKAAQEVFPDIQTTSLSIADGGEGTVAALGNTDGALFQTVSVSGPLGHPVQAEYVLFPEKKTAIIEMASASGLPLLTPEHRNPMKTSTFGTGQLILDAIQQGCRHITLAIGGSATNDGGTGALSALGIRFLDNDGNILDGKGENLSRIADIDLQSLNPLVKECHFEIMCDVQNPLTGPEGATYTFAAQKGADTQMQDQLEAGMCNFAKVVEEKLQKSAAMLPGSGAAGGLGFGMRAFLDAELRSGIESILDLLHFDSLLADVDLVITGEGRVDWQSAYGKVLAGVGKRCNKAGVPAIALVGSIGKGYEAVYDCGIQSVIPIVNGPISLDEAMKSADSLYLDAARRLFHLIRAIGTIKK